MGKRIFSFILIVVGIFQMLGFILNSNSLIYLGRVTAASPYPHVFGVIRDIEYWSQSYSIILNYPNGTQNLPITAETFSKIKGNHFIKMSYALSLSLSPILGKNWKIVWQKGLCHNGPLSTYLNLKKGIESFDIKIFSRAKEIKWEQTIRCDDE